ncbi:MAG: serine/threonine protein kinase [Proteobacteria bacterium]|nr:serine/threonine protein kinase [Pseudomonadota bacterium]
MIQKGFRTSMHDPAAAEFPSQLSFRYRYEKLLGEGSNGKTFLATSLITGQPVAIKALKLNQNDSFKSFELFKREAETLSSIRVPGVPKFYESLLADTPDGESFIIQEYINAPSLQTYLDKGRIFSEHETMLIMVKILAILHSLHTQYSPPIIHRDIKPSNILFDIPAPGLPWDTAPLFLIDFGAVANAHSNSDKSTIAGTVGYMAPEQNFGECLPQTDLYALGATALHMLTGIAPFDMPFDTYSIRFQEVLDAHAPKTSKEMRTLLGELLCYSYDKRPASASDVLDTLQAILLGRKPKSKTPPKPSLFVRMLRHIKGTLSKALMNAAPKENDYRDEITPKSVTFNRRKARFALGTIHATTVISSSAQQYTWEYTFACEGKFWLGLAKFPLPCAPFLPDPLNLAKQCEDAHFEHITTVSPQNLRLPAKCIVIYHANDPSISTSLYVVHSPHAPPN